MVQTILSQAGNPSFRKFLLPWRPNSCAYLPESKPIDPNTKLHPVDLVIVTNQKTTGQIERKSFYYLLGGPIRSRMQGHVEVKDSPPRAVGA